MKIEIFKRETQKKDGFPNYIIWDMDAMSRLSTATTYKLACEIKKDWEKLDRDWKHSIKEEIKEAKQLSLELEKDIPFT